MTAKNTTIRRIPRPIHFIIVAMGLLIISHTANASFIPIPQLKQPLTVSDIGSMIVTVKKGDTLSKILSSANINRNDITDALARLKPVFNFSTLRIGQKIKIFFTFPKDSADPLQLHKLLIHTKGTEAVEVQKVNSALFLAKPITLDTTSKIIHATGTIAGSLFASTMRSGVPQNLVMEFIKLYSFDVDFQREVKKGDQFTVIFEELYNDDNDRVGTGSIIYSSLTINDRELPIYLFTTPDGKRAYYDEKGRSIEKSFLRTPVDAARISSGYGMRRHPVIGYSKMHKGIDFAAPRGTPIFASGNGIVVEAKRSRSYGNFVKIDHQNGFQSLYAHMHRFGKGIRKGVYVKQGKVIGTVGSTGRTTGPHLHYELLKNKRHVNPLSIKMASQKVLKGFRLGIFQRYQRHLKNRFHL